MEYRRLLFFYRPIFLWGSFLLLICGCSTGAGSIKGSPVPEEIVRPVALPPELTPLKKVHTLSRGGLAVLMVMELPAEVSPKRKRERIVVDVSDHWARKEIIRVVRRGWMSARSGHRFQPDLPVTRGAAARIFDALLEQGGAGVGGLPVSGRVPRDLPKGHLLYPAVERLLAEGIMDLDGTGNFNPKKTVSGLEIRAALRKIGVLLRNGPAAADLQ